MKYLLMAALLLQSAPLKVPAPAEREWEITCPMEIKPDVPIKVVAKDRIWAMVGLGCTVWTEPEWKEAKEAMKRFKEQNRP